MAPVVDVNALAGTEDLQQEQMQMRLALQVGFGAVFLLRFGSEMH